MAMASNDVTISPAPPPSTGPPPPPYNRPFPWNNSFPGNFPPMINYTDLVSGTSGNSGSSSSSTYTRFFTVAVVCLCVVSSMVLFLHLYLRYVRRQHMQRHRRQTANLLRLSTFNLRSSSMRAGLDRDEISSIPSYQYQKEAGDYNTWNSTDSMASADCAVCLSVLEEGEVVRMLPACRHVFHVACIDKWLTSKASCPVCRADVSAQTHLPAAPAQPREAQPQSTGTDVLDVPVQEQSAKEETEAGTSVSTRLSSSFRRMLSSNRSSRRVQDDHTAVEDLERGNGTNSDT